MKNTVKSQNGITLIALVVTIVAQTKNTIALSELSKVQQVIIENYLKYVQLKNDSVLTNVGTKIEEVEEYNEINNKLKQISEDNFSLSVPFSEDVDKSYYKLSGENLKALGLENIHNNDVYVVNYSTGEVFNYTQKKTAAGDILYVKAK